MKKNTVFNLAGALLYLLAVTANFMSMALGGSSAGFGAVSSWLFAGTVLVFLLLSKDARGFVKLSLGYWALAAAVAVAGAATKAEILIPVITLLLTPLSGLVSDLKAIAGISFFYAALSLILLFNPGFDLIKIVKNLRKT